MAKIELWYKQDLKKPVPVRRLERVFNQDALGHLLGVEVYSEGQAVTLAGSVTGYCLLANGTTIPVAGTRSGNKASIIIPQAAYSVIGPITITVKLTEDNAITTLLAAVGMVARSRTGQQVDPGQTITDWTNQIAQAMQDVEDASAAQDAKIGDLKSALNNDEAAIVKSEYEKDMSISVGGVSTSTGKTNNNLTTRARLGYTRIIPGNTYRLQLANSDYRIMYIHRYTTDAESSWISPAISVMGNQYTFIAGENENYIRVMFSYVPDDSHTMTATDTANISASLTIYEMTDSNLNKFGIPADGKATGDAIAAVNEQFDSLEENLSLWKNMLPSYHFDWTLLKQSTAPLGWGIGFYKAEDGTMNSSDKHYMRTKDRVDSRFVSDNVVMCEVTPPNGYYILVCVTNLSDNSFVETLNGEERTVNKTVSFAFDPTKRYAFTLGYFNNNDSNEYLTAEFISSIKLRIYEKVSPFKEYNDKDGSASYIWNETLEYAIKLPEAYKPTGEPTPLVVVGHGLSATISSSSWGAHSSVDKFVSAGFAALDVNQVTTQDWCNPALIKKYIAALSDATEKYNVKPMYVFGYSMGSLIALCLATTIPGIKACAVSGIRLDFAARYATATEAEKAIIDTNLGFTNGFDKYIAAGWSKTVFNCVDGEGVQINPYQFPPLIVCYGTADTLTLNESLARAIEIKRGGTITKINSYEGADHSDMSTLNSNTTAFNDIKEWFDTWQ